MTNASISAANVSASAHGPPAPGLTFYQTPFDDVQCTAYSCVLGLQQAWADCPTATAGLPRQCG